MPDLTIPSGTATSASDSTLKDRSGRTHPAKKHVFQDSTHALPVTVTITNAAPKSIDWKADFDADNKSNRRRVMNLIFHDANNQPVTAFDPPVELRVALTNAEQSNANAHLVYYDPNARQWKSFSGATRVGGEIVVSISTWFDDPGVGLDAN